MKILPLMLILLSLTAAGAESTIASALSKLRGKSMDQEKSIAATTHEYANMLRAKARASTFQESVKKRVEDAKAAYRGAVEKAEASGEKPKPARKASKTVTEIKGISLSHQLFYFSVLY